MYCLSIKKLLLPFCLILAFQVNSYPGEEPSDFRVPSGVKVEQKEDAWLIQGKTRQVTIQKSDLQISVTTPAVKWKMLAADKSDLTIKDGTETEKLSLLDTGKREFSEYRNGFQHGLKISLESFHSGDKAFDFKMDFFLCLEGNEEDLVFRITAEEGKSTFRELAWPKPFAAESFDNTVVPFMQGMLLPKNWERKVSLYDTLSYGRGLYMPWWGHQQKDSAVLVLLETPPDAGCRFDHPAGGPTKIAPLWVHSLGHFSYTRQVRYCFMDKGNYVDLAKRYRQYVIETGHFTDLKTKIARNPLVGKLLGSPVIHTSILYHNQPDSSYYDKTNPQNNHQIVSFDERINQLKALQKKGIDRAYLHLDGWGFRGYDNLHPDILPPCLEAGGWDGMKRFADACEELNILFAVHDQYRDYYEDAASYEPRHTILYEDGTRPSGSTWPGGKQSVLCSCFAPGCVKRNHSALHEHGVNVKGAYLDVFAVVTPDECYNPEHPVTREQCLENRAHCFTIIRSFGGVISSEEPADWAIPFLDLVHHGPFALSPGPGNGPAMGIPIPLFSLVYHDALFLPWSMGKGEWGIPENDLGYLHGLLNAGLPYLSITPSEDHLQQVRTMCKLNQRVGLLEMTKHEFLDDTHRKQRTTFADGTTITADFDKDTFEIKPE